MRAASNAFKALLQSGTFLMADLFTFTLSTGQIYHYTDLDVSLTVGGNLFTASDILIKRGSTKLEIGVAVSTLEIDIVAGPSHLLNGIPWLQAALQGLLDGARVQLERVFMTRTGIGYDTSAGTVILFAGRISDVDISRTTLKLNVKSDLELLNISLPRNIWQPGCLHTLYDAGCTLSPASFGVNLTCLASTTASVLQATIAQASGYFGLGYLVMTSEAQNGQRRAIQTSGTNSITLITPLPEAPAPGDTFTAYPGCDKTQTTCTNKFSNLAHFRGMPYIPMPEAAT